MQPLREVRYIGLVEVPSYLFGEFCADSVDSAIFLDPQKASLTKILVNKKIQNILIFLNIEKYLG